MTYTFNEEEIIQLIVGLNLAKLELLKTIETAANIIKHSTPHAASSNTSYIHLLKERLAQVNVLIERLES